MHVEEAVSDEQISACFTVMQQLRPHLRADDFVGLVRAQRHEGYHLACVIDAGAVRAVAGFRMFGMLYCGRQMYVDDLVSDSASRSKGYGKAMLDWLEQHARAAGCVELHLDSGTQRIDAHRFYLRERMHILSFHFVKKLADRSPSGTL